MRFSSAGMEVAPSGDQDLPILSDRVVRQTEVARLVISSSRSSWFRSLTPILLTPFSLTRADVAAPARATRGHAMACQVSERGHARATREGGYAAIGICAVRAQPLEPTRRRRGGDDEEESRHPQLERVN